MYIKNSAFLHFLQIMHSLYLSRWAFSVFKKRGLGLNSSCWADVA